MKRWLDCYVMMGMNDKSISFDYVSFLFDYLVNKIKIKLNILNISKDHFKYLVYLKLRRFHQQKNLELKLKESFLIKISPTEMPFTYPSTFFLQNLRA